MRTSSSRPLLAALVASAFLIVGCGGSSGSDDAASDATTSTVTEQSTTTRVDGTTTTESGPGTTAAAGDDAICAPMQALRDRDAEANSLVATGDWPRIQAFYVDRTDDIVAIYDDAIALDTEISADLETLRDVTASAGDLAASSTSLIDFSGKLSSQPNLAASGQAALSANEYVQETCGFPLVGF